MDKDEKITVDVDGDTVRQHANTSLVATNRDETMKRE